MRTRHTLSVRLRICAHAHGDDRLRRHGQRPAPARRSKPTVTQRRRSSSSRAARSAVASTARCAFATPASSRARVVAHEGPPRRRHDGSGAGAGQGARAVQLLELRDARRTAPPKLVTDLKRLTDYSNGERTCNHPKAAADENGNIVWAYGSDYNSNRPNTYAGIINEKCEQLAAPQMVSIARDANDGAPDVTYLGDGKFIAGYYTDGGDTHDGPFPAEGGRYSVAIGLRSTPARSSRRSRARGSRTSSRRRTSAARPSRRSTQDRALFCAPQGPEPPERQHRVRARRHEHRHRRVEGRSSRRATAAEARSTSTSRRSCRSRDNKFALMAIESSGQGKQGNNVKGSNLSHLILLERNGDSITVGSEIVGAGRAPDARLDLRRRLRRAGRTRASPSSAPLRPASAAPRCRWSSSTRHTKTFQHDPKADLWPAAWYGDSGHLSNWYGRNPMRQGRDFMRCIGDVAEPRLPRRRTATCRT